MIDVAFALLIASAPASPGATVARVAERYLRDKPRLRRADCSGLVNDVLRDAGIASSGGARHQWERARKEGRALERVRRAKILPGDLVFFDRTYDSNRNGKVDDTLTHVAVVVRVDKDGTVRMVHRSSSKIEALSMNLARPADPKVNSYVRARGYGDAKAPRLTGQLFRGHARPAGKASPVVRRAR